MNPEQPSDGTGVAIVVLTHNKRELLQECVENVLARTSRLTREIVIWDNASFDGTAEYLESLRDSRIAIVRSERNIAQNAYANAFPMTRSSHLIELDDDIVDAPLEWDRSLLEAFVALDGIGYLGANLKNDPNDRASAAMYGPNRRLYRREIRNGIRLKLGPVGGWCAMTSRVVHDQVGGFPVNRKSAFFLEDGALIRRIEKVGLSAAILEDLVVHHKGGAYYAPHVSPEKQAFWKAHLRRRRRKHAVKRALLAIPLVPSLNARFHWFEPPPA